MVLASLDTIGISDTIHSFIVHSDKNSPVFYYWEVWGPLSLSSCIFTLSIFFTLFFTLLLLRKKWEESYGLTCLLDERKKLSDRLWPQAAFDTSWIAISNITSILH